MHFVTDLAKDHLIAVSFIFTTCTTICPPIGANFAKLERLLGERAGRDVILISISVDPVTDTPERLSAWAEKFGAGPGWTLLTGAKRDIDTLRKSMGAFNADKLLHTDTVLIGRASTGQWTRANALSRAEQLLKILTEFPK